VRSMTILVTIGTLISAAHAAGTVTFNLSSPSNGATVSPGALIEWTITVSVSSGDNLGLGLAAVDLVQFGTNWQTFQDADIATSDLYVDDPNDNEWGIERISATGFQVWDKKPFAGE
jgi:hypothetical protein